MITSEVIKHSMIAVISCLIQVLKSRSNDGFLVTSQEILWAPLPLAFVCWIFLFEVANFLIPFLLVFHYLL